MLPKLQELYLENHKISDAGCFALANACADEKFLPDCYIISLKGNLLVSEDAQQHLTNVLESRRRAKLDS